MDYIMLKYLKQSTTGVLHTAYGELKVGADNKVEGISDKDAKELSALLPEYFEHKGASAPAKKAEDKESTKPAPKSTTASKRTTATKKADTTK